MQNIQGKYVTMCQEDRFSNGRSLLLHLEWKYSFKVSFSVQKSANLIQLNFCLTQKTYAAHVLKDISY